MGLNSIGLRDLALALMESLFGSAGTGLGSKMFWP